MEPCGGGGGVVSTVDLRACVDQQGPEPSSVPKVDPCDYLGLDRGLRKGNNALRQKDWIGAQVEWSASPLRRKLSLAPSPSLKFNVQLSTNGSRIPGLFTE